MHIRTAFPYETTHEDLWIPLADGTRLYARIWRPLTEEPVPALLEYLPDRLCDSTAPRDAQRHPWYAGHGYASVRVDVRGHGNSEGAPATAEPSETAGTDETTDGVEVIHWLAAQPWCSGRVGMFGLSRGGVTSLRIAARAPGPLKAVVAVCPADDTPGDHRTDRGFGRAEGSVLTAGAHARAAAALARVARPPDPAHVGQVMWRDMWVARLGTVAPVIPTGPPLPARDEYGGDGGVDEDGSAIRAAVLAVSGWHDPYRDSVLRLVRSLPPDRVRGLIGPWSHGYPDQDRRPGPAIGFLQETLRWWDHWLEPHGGRPPAAPDARTPAGTDHRPVMAEPLLRSYVMDAHPPATACTSLPGRWVGDTAWPSPLVTVIAYPLRGAPVLVRSPQHTGVDAGRFRPVGGDADLPPDQREEDARSVCFEFEVPGETWILGRPRVRLRLTSHSTRGQVIARVCDVAPDGASTLVTRGALHLSARYGRDQAVPWEPGTTEDVRFELDAIGYAVPPGHRVRLSLSSAYWPWIWPEPGSEAGFTLDPSACSLELPVRARESDPVITFAEPEHSAPLGVASAVTLDEPRPERRVLHDVAKDEWRLETVPRDGGTLIHPDGLEHTEEALETYSVRATDPLSARTHSSWSIRLRRAEPAWDARVQVRSEVTCDAHDFITSSELVCQDGDEVVFHRTWERRIPRTVARSPGDGLADSAERDAAR
ncbi:CocE/NonD family hydrolase [Streptomyces fagopyri]